MTARVAVVGGGIAGLSAAWELERHGAAVTVFEATDHVGGKLRRSAVAGLGIPLDEGADAFLARVPDALELCAEIGIDELEHPAIGRAFVFAHGALRPLPAAHLLGVPTDLDDLASTGLVSDGGLERARSDLTSDASAPTEDMSVGALVRSRLGDEVCDHLVEPLLGGINAGEADLLSAAAVAPQIWACANAGGSLIRAAAETRNRAVASGDPVFATPAHGMAALPEHLVARLAADIRRSTPAPALRLDDNGAHLGDEPFDGVIVATPADVAATLLQTAVPDAADVLGRVDFASVVMVTVVADAASVDHALDGSGFVVARTAGVPITACSWGSSKWAHWADGDHAVFRISIGHDADPTDWCSYDDASLVAVALDGLQSTMGIEISPVGSRVGRWRRSFPQYRPGHLDLVADVHRAAAAAGPVALAGASLGGIGVPACIRQGRAAARTLLGRQR
ncbi:protoporphyrinogen oxidase [Actinospongicola halichondriae]|uniref:protoporphyrinogen oxidase n=1 Tax=Actinospongicola halichondriae TaxID=3236844 RepID=UPI003D4A15F9